MIKQKLILFVVLLLGLNILMVCQTKIDEVKKEINEVEKDFANMVNEKGMEVGFLSYASEDAVLLRGNKLVKGKAAIKEYFENQTLQNVSLDWEVEYVDVSSSGDLAYTYGEYYFTATTPEGEQIDDVGVFHTVWKKNKQGKWKFVWD